MPLQAIWAKGYTELLDLVEKDSATSDMHSHIDCYGYGDDLHEVRLWLLRSCQISLLTLHSPGLVPHHHSSKGKKAEARLISPSARPTSSPGLCEIPMLSRRC